MMPLAMVSTEEELRLFAIHGRQCMRKRLADLGLNLGATLRVMQCDVYGPLIISVKDSRLALRRGIACKIMVEPA